MPWRRSWRRLEAEVPGLFTAYTPNITQGKGGVTIGYTDTDWIRAIRHGLRRDGTPLFMMPSGPLSKLTDADVGAIVAAVKSFPAVDREMPKYEIGPIGYMLIATDQLPMIHAEMIDHTTPAPKAVTYATPQELGKYLASTGGCVDCHRDDLSGGRIPGTPESIPPASNLTQAGPIAKYTEADFLQLFRSGKRPNGSNLNEIMPWKAVGNMHDQELAALYAYLRSLPPVATR
jgi:cytochrome c553